MMMMEIVLSLLFFVITILCVLVSMAFFTLMERKLLGYMQMRKGPNKVGVLGLPQPLADAGKLFLKEQASPLLANRVPYFFAPLFSLLLSLLSWVIYPFEGSFVLLSLGVVYFLCVTSMNVYGTMVAGWGSNSKYALLGALRAVAQTISYEVSLVLILLGLIVVFLSYDLVYCSYNYFCYWVGVICLPLSVVWVISSIAETNRAPFDFAEGESELVSGFNIEYSAGGFALIFMAEYTSILLMSMISAALFFGCNSIFVYSSVYMFTLKVVLFAGLFVWVRGAYPRYRYDLLMSLAWKKFLPLSLFYLFVELVYVISLFSM